MHRRRHRRLTVDGKYSIQIYINKNEKRNTNTNPFVHTQTLYSQMHPNKRARCKFHEQNNKKKTHNTKLRM